MTWSWRDAPPVKFGTNYLVYQIADAAKNILRLMGRSGLLALDAPVQHAATRFRIKTNIQELFYKACRISAHGSNLTQRRVYNGRRVHPFNRLYSKPFAIDG